MPRAPFICPSGVIMPAVHQELKETAEELPDCFEIPVLTISDDDDEPGVGALQDAAAVSSHRCPKDRMETHADAELGPQVEEDYIKLAELMFLELTRDEPGEDAETSVEELDTAAEAELKTGRRNRLEPAAKLRRGSRPGTDVSEGVGRTRRRHRTALNPPGSAYGPLRGDQPPPASQFSSAVNDQPLHAAKRPAGVRNISWRESRRCWVVCHGGKKFQYPAAKWLAEGLALEEAVARSLDEAKTRVAELTARGIIRDPLAPSASGRATGVDWHRGSWRARLQGKDAAGKRFFVEQHFRPADATEAALEEARLRAARCRQEMEARHRPSRN